MIGLMGQEIGIHRDILERLVTHIKWIFIWCVKQQQSCFQFDDDKLWTTKAGHVKFCMKIENTRKFGMKYFFFLYQQLRTWCLQNFNFAVGYFMVYISHIDGYYTQRLTFILYYCWRTDSCNYRIHTEVVKGN
jgi:hypothetical protein